MPRGVPKRPVKVRPANELIETYKLDDVDLSASQAEQAKGYKIRRQPITIGMITRRHVFMENGGFLEVPDSLANQCALIIEAKRKTLVAEEKRAATLEKEDGSKEHLSANLIKRLNHDFRVHGRRAIAEVRKTNPVQYLKLVASLAPKEVKVEHSIADTVKAMDDNELDQRITELERELRRANGGPAARNLEARAVGPIIDAEAVPVLPGDGAA